MQLPFRDDSRVRMPTYIACVCVLLVVAFVHLSSAVLIADLCNARRGCSSTSYSVELPELTPSQSRNK
jgi:hypothetical protein